MKSQLQMTFITPAESMIQNGDHGLFMASALIFHRHRGDRGNHRRRHEQEIARDRANDFRVLMEKPEERQIASSEQDEQTDRDRD